MSPTDLRVSLGPLSLAYPIVNCSGTLDLFELAATVGEEVLRDPPVAAYVPKTVTLAPRSGNPPPRIVETPGGMLNSIGLPNAGVEAFIGTDLPRLLRLPRPLILNVGGFSPGEYALAAGRLRSALDMLTEGQVPDGARQPGWVTKVGLELNVSCPNVHSGCMSIGTDPAETSAAVRAVREVWPGLLVVKLTPNVTDMAAVARAAEDAGASALSLVNTFKGLVLDRHTLRPYLGGGTGGLSGPAIKPLALRFVYEVFRECGLPIVGMGGVSTVRDVVDFMACGASVVAVGSAAFQDPWLGARLAVDLAGVLDERGWEPADLVGKAHE